MNQKSFSTTITNETEYQTLGKSQYSTFHNIPQFFLSWRMQIKSLMLLKLAESDKLDVVIN